MQQELIQAWMYTVNNELGMFSVNRKQTNPLIADGCEEQGGACAESPQDVWLEFFIKRFEVIGYYSNEQVSGNLMQY